MENDYNLGVRIGEGEMFEAGIAYVVIPSDIDRDKYIGHCYRTSTVSIFSEFNGNTNNVPVDYHTLNFINFPKKVNEFGSAVSFKVDPVKKRPIVDGLYLRKDEICDLVEHQFKFRRTLDNNFVEISGSPLDSNISVIVGAKEGGEISLIVRSADQSAKVSIDVDGDLVVKAANNTIIRQTNKFQVATVNPDDEEELSVLEQTSKSHIYFDELHSINTDKFLINNGKEPFILGNILRTFLDNFIDEIGKTTVTTSLGQMPILNKAQVVAFKERTEALLSTVAFIDV